MAHLVEINTPRSDSERAAQELLATSLPDSWLLTTNIKEHNFLGRRKPEIDSIVISPLGVFVLDFKNFRGRVTPMTNRAWGGLEENLFEQASDNVFPVKDLMKSRAGELFVGSIIVFTHEDAEIDWQFSDVVGDQRLRVRRVRDVEASIRDIAGNRRRLDPEKARKALEALKPAEIPEYVFRHTDWPAASAFPRENSQTQTRDEAKYGAGGNERRTTAIDEQRTESPAQNLLWRRVGFAVLALVGIVVWHLWDSRSANVDARLEEQRRIEIVRRQREQQQDEERRSAEQRRLREEQMRRTEQQRQQQEYERRVAMITEGIRSGRCGGNPRGAYWCCDPGMWARPGGACSRSR